MGKRSAVFDVPEEFRLQMDKLISLSKVESSPIKDYEIILVNSMEMLSDDEDEEKGAEED